MTHHITRIATISLKNAAHLYHCVPIACELAKQRNVAVDIFTDTQHSTSLIESLAQSYNVRCNIQRLKPSAGKQLLNALTQQPARAKDIISHNKAILRHYDCIISPDFYTNPLILSSDTDRPRFIFSFHGAGDHAYGFKRKLCHYDLILVSGPMIKQRLEKEHILDCTDWLETGYPKFDLLDQTTPKALFHNHRKTVLYTPHFQRKETSWYDWGLDVMEYFYNSTKYNLIFAPHVLLMTKWRRRRVIPKRYYSAPHLHLDFGSSNSLDMTYTRLADLYLGDVSSQVYEFLYQPRPCVFLNSKLVDWRNNPDFLHWKLGTVVQNITSLDNAINKADTQHSAHYLERQKLFFAEKFSHNSIPAAKRAADGILLYLSGYPKIKTAAKKQRKG